MLYADVFHSNWCNVSFFRLLQGIQICGMFWSPWQLILKCSAHVSQRSRDALVVPWACCELLGGGTGQVPGAVCACTRYRTLPPFEFLSLSLENRSLNLR